MRLCVFLLGCCVPAILAQTPTDIFDKAPPHIDQALRSRVSGFFQAFVDKKFRAADQFVAEDSKDAFFTMEKKPYLGFEIARINYSENFTKATVVTAIDVEWRTPRTGVMRVKTPMNSLWKVENGEWFWYIQPQKDWDTPWGKMNPGPDPQGPRTVLDAFKGVTAVDVLNSVKISKSSVTLSSYEPASDSVEISNSMPGEVKLTVERPSIDGFQVELDRDVLKQGEAAKLSLHYAPKTKEPKPTMILDIRVDPIGKTFPLKVMFAVPPQAQRPQQPQ